MSPRNNKPESQPYAETENFLTMRLLYHLWRVDSAARAFPSNLTEGVSLNIAKARWTIGLTLEMVCLARFYLDISFNLYQHGVRESAADIALLGLMTESLSTELALRLRWFDMASPRHDAIIWELLPTSESSPPVPSPPWIFSYEPNMITARNRWWEDANDGNGKPDWWNDTAPEVFTFQRRCLEN